MDYKDLADDDLVHECGESPYAEAWEEFIRRFQPQIAVIVTRTCREWGETRPDVIEDLIQNTYLKLCANDYAVLRRYRPRHQNSFRGYLKVVTAHLVYDWFRKQHPIDNKTDELNTEINPARGGHKDDEIFFHDVDHLLRQRGNGPTEERERTIFWLYYRQGLTAKEIAAIPAMNLTIKGVESCIFRLTIYVKKRLLGGENPGGILPEGSF